jgi:hypothetical protein
MCFACAIKATRLQTLSGLTPLAEAPVPKDLWISSDAEVVYYPPIPNELLEHHANLLFSGVAQEVRALNPEIPGGHIALIATVN